jgi:hypothetical protein
LAPSSPTSIARTVSAESDQYGVQRLCSSDKALEPRRLAVDMLPLLPREIQETMIGPISRIQYLLQPRASHQLGAWPNGKALDYESRDCRFDPCRAHTFCQALGAWYSLFCQIPNCANLRHQICCGKLSGLSFCKASWLPLWDSTEYRQYIGASF